jgi:hypothetical protein
MTGVQVSPIHTASLVPHGAQRRRSWLITAICVAGLSAGYAALAPGVSWSFLLAISACGTLIGVDAVAWLTTRMDLYDPVGLVGLYGVFFFYLAPMITVGWLAWPAYLPTPRDLQGSFARLSWLYVVGLICYRVAIDRWQVQVPATAGALHHTRFRVVMLSLAGLAAVAYAAIVISFGGPSGYYSVMTQGQGQTMQALSGYGPVITVASWLPMSLLAVILVSKRDALRSRPWLIILTLTGFLALTIAIDGLRGSRGAVVWPLLIAVGMVHYVVRSVPKLAAIMLVPALFAFMFVYGIYKSAGTEGLSQARSFDGAMSVITDSNRTLSTLLIGDFARTTTQVLTFEAVTGSSPASPAWGATYLGDLLIFVPGQVLPGIPNKVEVGSEALRADNEHSALRSLIYGMSGEGMLNFGVAGAVLAFAIWIPLVHLAGRFAVRAGRLKDLGAGLLAPGLGLLAVYFLFNDLDNCVTFVLSFMMPILIGVLASRGPVTGQG